MFKSLFLALAMIIASLCAVSALAAPGGGGGGNRLRLEARMRQAPMVEAKIAYEERNGVRKVTVEVSRATPMTQFAASHRGVVFATVTTNDLGSAKLERFSSTDNPGQAGDVPMMAAGDAVGVGAMTGTLQPR